MSDCLSRVKVTYKELKMEIQTFLPCLVLIGKLGVQYKLIDDGHKRRLDYKNLKGFNH